MSKPLTSYEVTFLDTLRVNVAVKATTPKQAHRLAVEQWCADLWDRADAALTGAASEISESDNRTCIAITALPQSKSPTNESTPHGQQ